MTREEAIKLIGGMKSDLNDFYDYDDLTALDMAISALSEKEWKFYYDHGSAQAKRDLSENKGDLISRQAVINAIANTCFWLSADNWEELTKCINSIPSVENKGTWRHYEGMLYCSKCGAEFYDEIMEYTGDEVPKHCPDCGADMRGKAE